MGNTFNAFVKFISDDPIMLGLCIAIIVLIIAFILVLFLGRKKDDKEECVADNTAELLKTEINMDALKSTQEFSVNELQNSEPGPALESQTASPIETFGGVTPDANIPTLEPTPAAMEVPVTIEAAPVSLEVPSPTQAPIIETTSPTIENVNTTPESIYDSNIFDISMKEAPVQEPTIEPVPLDSSSVAPIIESTVNPVEPATIPSLESVFGASPANANSQPVTSAATPTPEPKEEVILPTITEPTPKIEAPFSSVNVDANAELPSINTAEFSRTEIIKHIPVMESAPTPIEQVSTVTEDDDLDDIDLPMLNTSPSSEPKASGLNALQGETFNI